MKTNKQIPGQSDRFRLLVFVLLVFLFFFCTLLIKAQQLPQFTQRSEAPLIYNPAVAGSVQMPEIKLRHRNQWLGFKGAPVTQTLSYHSVFFKKVPELGPGTFFMNDYTGPLQRQTFSLAAAYHIFFGEFLVGAGMSGVFSRCAIDGNKINTQFPDNSIYEGDYMRQKWMPNAAAGIYVYNSDFYFGLSAQQLLPNDFTFEMPELSKNARLPQVSHYYISGGYDIGINRGVYVVSPSFLYSCVPGAPSQIDINVKLEYFGTKNHYISGITCRYKDAAALLLGVRFEKYYYIAYSYDLVISSLRNVNSGSHEIMFAFTFPHQGISISMYNLEGRNRGQIKRRIKQMRKR